jgi:hypothetical protein
MIIAFRAASVSVARRRLNNALFDARIAKPISGVVPKIVIHVQTLLRAGNAAIFAMALNLGHLIFPFACLFDPHNMRP